MKIGDSKVNLAHWYHVSEWPSTIRELFRSIGGFLRDRFEGIHTSGNVSVNELGSNEITNVRYQPSPWNGLKKTLLIGDVTNQDVFIDFGSGKGRILYLAASYYPFKKVIGVEISEELNKIARHNIQRSIPKFRCKDVQIVTSSVSEYKIPNDITIVYMFNPFIGEAFEDFLANLQDSLVENPRRMRVIYRNPKMHDCLVNNGFHVIKKVDSITVYELAI